MKPLVIICGAPGSGTSLVTRMLRHAGMFAGSDAGPLKSRKFHESDCFRTYNQQFLAKTIDFPHAPKGVRQFDQHVEIARRKMQQLVDLVDRTALMETYRGEQHLPEVCGWKDPRNSATALIWRNIFPELRVLVVNRKWKPEMREQESQSPAGFWFRSQSSQQVRQLYVSPPDVDDLDIHHASFDQLLVNQNELEDLLRWMGLPLDPARDFFDRFLRVAGVESKLQR